MVAKPPEVAGARASLTKDSNPKSAYGDRKVPFTTLPLGPVAEVGLAMLEGARKYGRHNYRVEGVRASTYIDAAMRHLAAFWEGEDIDPDSGLSHLAKAAACCLVLRDAMFADKLRDDRPPPTRPDWLVHCNRKASALVDRYPNPKEPHTAQRGRGGK